MIQSPLSSTQHQADLLVALANTSIKQLAQGGKARSFYDAIGQKLGEVETRQFLNLAQTLYPFATGDSLDMIGELFGVYRIQQQDAQVISNDNNFQFYVKSGTFGDINNGQDIQIPAGVRLYSGSPSGPVYTTLSAVLPAAAAIASVGAVSLLPGALGNAPASSLVLHNFTNYSDFSLGALLVTNNFGVVGGRDIEDDDSYRYRINLKLKSTSGIDESALRLQLLSLQGIQNAVFQPQSGTFLVYLYGISPMVPASLVQMAQQIIDAAAAFPIIGTAVTPDLVGISLDTTISLVNGTSSSEQSIIVANATAAAQSYINNLGTGQQLIINTIADTIRSSDARISDVGQPNQEIADIFIWRARSDGSRYSRFLVANYNPSIGERILVEPSQVNAINIAVAT